VFLPGILVADLEIDCDIELPRENPLHDTITIPDEEESPSPRVAEPDNLPFPEADAAATGIFEPCRHGGTVTDVSRDDVHIELQTQRLADHRKTFQEACLLVDAPPVSREAVQGVPGEMA
jgi:hypothetical protein